MLTPTLRFKAQMFPNKGLLSSRTSEFLSRGGFQLSLSRVIVGLFLALVATPGTTSLRRITWTIAFSSRCNVWPDSRRCLRAVQSLASDHFRLLGERGVSDPPRLSARKITDWDTQLGVLGWITDTEALTVTLPSHKRLKLELFLRSGPRLVHLLKPGRCRRMLASLYMSPFLCVRGGFS